MMDLAKELRDVRMPNGAIIGLNWVGAAELERQREVIATLEAQLSAARGEVGEIVGWLKHTIKSTKLDVADGLWVGISEDAESFINTLRIMIDAIEARAYKEKAP